MESILLDIIDALKARPELSRLDNVQTQAIVRAHNAGLDAEHHFAKKQLLPYYQRVKASDLDTWRSWNIDPALEKRLLATLQVKPRRTASGVATITVITRPAPCANACLYCPNDIRMPKSYLSHEPACQRAERNYFDPYLQVISRARALHEMGHNIEKIELIVLGGTWCDYPIEYQRWFATELFRACNNIEKEIRTLTNGDTEQCESHLRLELYQQAGLLNNEADLEHATNTLQQEVNAGNLTYNEAIAKLYGQNSAWETLKNFQSSTPDELHEAQQINGTAKNRVVGFVVETRPDTITPIRLAALRDFGCTKVQMGIQSMNPDVLAINNRKTALETVECALDLTRLFGFKIHTHFMVNLAGTTPEIDKADYLNFINNLSTTPDEVKLYPCALVEGTGLCSLYRTGDWRPYTEGELIDVLSADVLATPKYCRISRMIRDIGANDILVGNKKTNLRQMVDQHLVNIEHSPVHEIRQREIKTDDFDHTQLRLNDVTYKTAVSIEHFLEWVTPDNKIAGFLRLSLPVSDALEAVRKELLNSAQSEYDADKSIAQAAQALRPGAAMIREVHVYGRAANIGATVDGAQHIGLGKQLIARAEELARDTGYTRLNVISSIGTRRYYKARGFKQVGLYQQKPL